MKQNYRLKHCEKLLELGISKKEILSRLKTTSSRNINYWLERGYSDEESKKMVLSRIPGKFEYFLYFKGLSESESRKKVIEFEKNKKNTKDNFIKRYGQIDGSLKWDEYCDKHRQKNTFEFKHKKFGWDKNQFDDYNKSRSITLNNLIKKHGDVVGGDMWRRYVNRQSYTKSQKYVVSKYGEDEWKKLCKSKSHTYENFLERWEDVEIATKKYNEYLKNHSNFTNTSFSKIANELFDSITLKCINFGFNEIYTNSCSQEWMLIVKNYGCIYLDFFLKDNGRVIEFYGDYWHANPDKYCIGTRLNFGCNGFKNVEDVWEHDRIRMEHIKRVPYVKDIKIVWENSFRKNPQLTIDECIEFLTK